VLEIVNWKSVEIGRTSFRSLKCIRDIALLRCKSCLCSGKNSNIIRTIFTTNRGREAGTRIIHVN